MDGEEERFGYETFLQNRQGLLFISNVLYFYIFLRYKKILPIIIIMNLAVLLLYFETQ